MLSFVEQDWHAETFTKGCLNGTKPGTCATSMILLFRSMTAIRFVGGWLTTRRGDDDARTLSDAAAACT